MMTSDGMTPDAGGLLAKLFSTPAMERVFSDTNLVQQMLRFEWALQAALADCGVAPAGSAKPLAALLESPFLTAERADKLQGAAALSGNIAIPFVKMLTAAVAEEDKEAARFVHTGATSQDVLDTALVLQLQEAIALMERDLGLTLERCVALAREHTETVMAGRTWMQQGPPVTLGLKLAGCAAALARHRERLQGAAARLAVLQFGGAVGTLASLGKDGIQVSAALGRRLQLPEPAMPWHSHRDNLAEMATVLGLLTGTLGKMARDLSLGMQTEVGEVFEPAGQGKGGSSTMPHKRNPVGSAVVLAAALRVPSLVATMLVAMPQEHERGLGGWHAEWETLPEIFRLTAGALQQMREILDGLEVHADRMRENLDMTRGLVLAEAVSSALAETLGRAAAHRLVEEASQRALREGCSLEQVLLAMPEVVQQLPPERIHQLLDPRHYLGSSAEFLDRALRALERRALELGARDKKEG
jgi:3-carboxy-cis,cis-muconate cycloisomerase